MSLRLIDDGQKSRFVFHENLPKGAKAQSNIGKIGQDADDSSNRSAGVPPAVLRPEMGTKIAGETPALPNPQTHGTRALTTGTIHTAYPRGSRMLAII